MSPIERVDYADAGLTLTGQLVRPQRQARALVVVFPTIMNQAPNVERRLSMLADAGYAALLADFYGRAPADRADAHALGSALRVDVAAYRARIAATVAKADEIADGLPLAAIGYCMGGQAVLEAARMNLPLAAVASFHGILSTDAPATQPIKPRILVCHGDKDPLVDRAQVAAFEAEMDAAGADWHLNVYAKARHGFTDPHADSHGIAALGYDASADRQSWAAMLALFDEELSR